MKPESKYTFEKFTNGKGFRIFRLKKHVITVAYLDGGFKVWSGSYLKYASPMNIFCFRNIIENIAEKILNKVKQPGKKCGWIKVRIGKALAKRVSFHLKDIITTLPKDVVKVSKRLFTVNIKSPRFFDNKFKKKDITQIMKYRGAAYFYNTNNVYNANWRKSFGKLDKNQRETLNKLPGNISIGLVQNRLSSTKLDKPVFNRSELTIKLCSYLAEDYQDLLLRTSKEQFKKAMKIHNNKYSLRKTKDICSFIIDVSNFGHKAENLLDLVILEKEKNAKSN